MYRFYDPEGNAHQIRLRGMNHLKDLEQRRDLTQSLLNHEMDVLNQGFNPIIARMEQDPAYMEQFLHEPDCVVHESTPFIQALEKVIPLTEYSRNIKNNLSWCVNKLKPSAIKLGYDKTPIFYIKPRHILLLLKKAEEKEPFTAQTYNHLRSYLFMMFKTLFLLGAVDANQVRDIPKRKLIKRIPKVLNRDQRKQVDEHLKIVDPAFWRYMRIFYYSGARSTELVKVKVKDVRLELQQYLVTVSKGASIEEVVKPITLSALPLWQELIHNADPEHYVFGRGFKPGKLGMKSEVVYRRWKKMVKDPLGIDIGFYKLKHANTTDVVTLLSEEAAANLNAHTSTDMVKRVYDLEQANRHHEKIKQLRHEFV